MTGKTAEMVKLAAVVQTVLIPEMVAMGMFMAAAVAVAGMLAYEQAAVTVEMEENMAAVAVQPDMHQIDLEKAESLAAMAAVLVTAAHPPQLLYFLKLASRGLARGLKHCISSGFL